MHNTLEDFEVNSTEFQIHANGKSQREHDLIVIHFKDKSGSHQVQYKLSTPALSNTITASFYISNWEKINYIAIGYTLHQQFKYVKIIHPVQKKWIDISFHHQDLIYKLQNDGREEDDALIEDIRIYIKGEPNRNDGVLKIKQLSHSLVKDSLLLSHPILDVLKTPVFHPLPLQRVLYHYFAQNFKNSDAQVEEFLHSGSCPFGKKVNLPWSFHSLYPTHLSENTTYRFSWHSLHPATILMLYAYKHNEQAALFSAREFITSWLDNNFYTASEDKKYAWYDHSVAERQLSFILMYSLGQQYQFDARFMHRLFFAIYEQAKLLASEAFYALNQPTRYHNHAWFQDLALIVTSIIFPHLSQALQWRQVALCRLDEQFERLIVSESGFSVFIENSIGYQHGVQNLISFMTELLNVAKISSNLSAISTELKSFCHFLRYPNGHSPSQGDTFRLGNLVTQAKKSKSQKNSFTLLSKTGYAIVKGEHHKCSYMLTLFATSLCQTHKHEDNLSFTLFFDNIEWLIDPSYYSHEYKDKIPSYLRSASAHNCLSVADLDYSTLPGLAHLEGGRTNDQFNILGSHQAYKDILIQRQVSGTLKNLDIELTDIAITQSNIKNSLFLMLHCGEGVKVHIIEEGISLIHPQSHYMLSIHLPKYKVVTYFGQTEGNKIRGIAGQGFLQFEKIYSIELEIPFNESLTWRIQANKR